MTEVSELTKLVAQVASSYLGAQRVNGPEEIAAVVRAVAESLKSVDGGGASGVGSAGAEPAAPKLTKGQIAKLIKDDGIISLLDGKTYKTMKRHLSTHGLTPAEYIERFSLPTDFPMVSPAYSRARSEMAKSIGLGRKLTRTPPAAASKAAAKPRAKKAARAG
jgi:predicted transcriptional regulator